MDTLNKLVVLPGKRWSVIILLSLLSGLSACSMEDLYTDLNQQQVNEMLAVLINNGVEASKVRTDKTWTLRTNDLGQAMSVLQAHGYPRESYQSLGDIFRAEGLVPSPTEERARLLYGMSQELSHTLSTYDGVVVARVHLSIPERNPLTDKRGPSSAAVFIKHRADSQVVHQVPIIKNLVVNSVEGLQFDNVSVTLTEAEPVREKKK